jgi:predicted dehydrogenase
MAILALTPSEPSLLNPLIAYLQALPHCRVTLVTEIPEDLAPFQAVITEGLPSSMKAVHTLEGFVRSGGGWLLLIAGPGVSLPDVFGARSGPVGPVAEMRLFLEPAGAFLAARLPEAFYVTGIHHPLVRTAGDAAIVLAADWHYRHSPLIITRPVEQGLTACCSLRDLRHPLLHQILYRLVRFLAGFRPREKTLGLGILGYSPAMGRFHGLAAEATAGFRLQAVADLSPEARRQAALDFPQSALYSSAEHLAADSEVELVIIATPPDSHARLSRQMLAAGKHVVCEKPLALTYRDAAAMMEDSNQRNLHLSCHQNRRFDVDYLSIRQALSEGLLGDLFYLETFVGGFAHPCGFWHSHEPICGGTAFDWGGHYVDWLISLVPDRVRQVIGTRHKRVWHDVSNADQERVQIRFRGGQEAEFLHSDIAAFRKPKWYLLGTQGALVGDWRDESVFEIDPVQYYRQQDIPGTEMTPLLRLYRRHPSGDIVPQHLALAKRRPFLFHRNLADHLLTGEPLVAPLSESVRVVAVLEAAARSAVRGGTVEPLDV